MIRSFIVAAALLWTAAAHAQAGGSGGGLGQPLPDPKLPNGTITVRVVDGDLKKPLTGNVVELTAPDGNKLTARTDENGRATFGALKGGLTFVAHTELAAETGAKTSLKTAKFTVPERGGIRFILSAKPIAGAPMMAGQGGKGMPNLRTMSGQARGEGQDPAGRLTIRTVQGRPHPTESRAPIGAKIHLIGYKADGTTTLATKVVDDSERVRFDGLATNGSVSYFVTSLFNRAAGVDRLVSHPVGMLPQVGMRLMLASPAADSKDAPVDDLSRFEETRPAPPGKVTVEVAGDLRDLSDVELVRIGSDAVAKSPLLGATPRAGDVRGGAMPATLDPKLRDRLIYVRVIRGARAVPGIEVVATAKGAPKTVRKTTDADGAAVFDEFPAGTEVTVSISVFGREMPSKPTAVPASGGVGIEFRVEWMNESGSREAVFDSVAPGDGAVYFARVAVAGKTYRSRPFQLTDALGARVTIMVVRSLLFRFHTGGQVDDEKFFFELQVSVINTDTAPAPVGKDGLLIPLPKGFIHGRVDEQMGARVRLVPDKGIALRGPIPPGNHRARVSFALPVDKGEVSIDWELPLGAFQSQLAFVKSAGLKVSVPKGVVTQPSRDGRFIVAPVARIRPGERLVMGLSGLPMPRKWKGYAGLVAGLIVIGLLVGTVVLAVRYRVPEEGEHLVAERDRLLGLLAQLKDEDTDLRQKLREQLRDIYHRLGDVAE